MGERMRPARFDSLILHEALRSGQLLRMLIGGSRVQVPPVSHCDSVAQLVEHQKFLSATLARFFLHAVCLVASAICWPGP